MRCRLADRNPLHRAKFRGIGQPSPWPSIDRRARPNHPWGMEVRLHDVLDDFRRVAVGIYRRDPVLAMREFMILRDGLPDSNPATLLVTVWDGAAAVGAAMKTPRTPLLCGGLPEVGLGDVVTQIACVRPHLNSIQGPRNIAMKFAAAWHEVTGEFGTIRIEKRLHRLESFDLPSDVAGEPRPAVEGDTDVLVDWLGRFHAEASCKVPNPAATARYLQNEKDSGVEFLFWTSDGDPVSLVGVRSPVAGVSRIGPLYTPTDKRGHGYGKTMTVAAAAFALEHGAAEVVAFTDPANPVSNRICQVLGFQWVSDSVCIDFSAPI